MSDLRAAAERGVVLLGCGKMGGAILEGWLDRGLSARSVRIIDPKPDEALRARGVSVNADMPDSPAAVLLAVKPQVMGEALAQVARFTSSQTLFLSIAAGLTLRWFEARLGAATPLVRAMPNTPAAVGRGITALCANAAGADHLDLAEALMRAVGEVARLPDEGLMDAVTAVSGSGPAYLFHMIEALAAAGQAEGLPRDLAMRLARVTMCGAGELASRSEAEASALRQAVTSPGGTTQAALETLMDAETGLSPLMRRTVKAAARRSRELAEG